MFSRLLQAYPSEDPSSGQQPPSLPSEDSHQVQQQDSVQQDEKAEPQQQQQPQLRQLPSLKLQLPIAGVAPEGAFGSEREEPDKQYTPEEVAKHSSRKDLWIIINDKVYDVTSYHKEHPGGAAALLQWGGRDATEAAKAAHGSKASPIEKMKELVIGNMYPASPTTVENAAKTAAQFAAGPEGKRMIILSELKQQTVSPASSSNTTPRLGIESKQVIKNLMPPPPPPSMHSIQRVEEEQSMTNSMSMAEIIAEEPDAYADFNVESFDELILEADFIEEARNAWEMFRQNAGSDEAAGDIIYTALFESVPSMQVLFNTPKAVQAMRFITQLSIFVNALADPPLLKSLVETLAFAHMSLEITPPRVLSFRDSIIESLELDLGSNFSPQARRTWQVLLGYIGGAIMYIKQNYSERMLILEHSWRKASGKDKAASGVAEEEVPQDLAHKQASTSADEVIINADAEAMLPPQDLKPESGGARWKFWKRRSSSTSSPNTEAGSWGDTPSHRGSFSGSSVAEDPRPDLGSSLFSTQAIVRTFEGMFDFNAAVMGFAKSLWLREIVTSFDNIVVNIAKSRRLQEECDLAVCKIRKVHKGEVNLGHFKSIMLATLRSLLPKEWDSSHEVAWNWLWENVENLLYRSLDKCLTWQVSLNDLTESMDEKQAFWMRKEIYARYFKISAAGQEHFKQSDTRLHFISAQIFRMTADLFSEPHKMVDEISSLGLRHVGYGIPVDAFGPFVTVYVEVVGLVTDDPVAVEAFRWSLGLLASMLTRSISEGSTIVMKAINDNSMPQLRKALGSAPRGERAQWVLKVEVGTQSISPLLWSIDSGRIEAADIMIEDLLTIRADRERYYYGMEDLFDRHGDIIKRLCTEAPTCLPTLLDGLIWRCRSTSQGQRRVNYYVERLLVKPNGDVSDALGWLVAAKEPKTMVHPVIVLVSDTLWSRLIARQFIVSKIWFIGSLIIFMLSQAILPKSDSSGDLAVRILIFLGRLFTYAITLCRLLWRHGQWCFQAYRTGDTFGRCCVRVPKYLKDPGDCAGFFLMWLVLLMCTHEPMSWCLGDGFEDFPTETCDSFDDSSRLWYSVFVMGAMAIHWLMLIDLAVFSTGLSAFVLVIWQVLSEMTRFLAALIFLLLTFGSAISVLDHPYFEMRDIPNCAIALFSITVRLYEDDYRNMLGEPALLGAVFIFVTASAVVLLNLLIAQINCSYVYIYQDMLGFARLNRAAVIVETLEQCHEETWSRFVKTLKMDEPLEFNEGDIGLSGGLQVLEPAHANPVLTDRIMRFGGSCAPDMPWPEDSLGNEEEDKYNRIERLLGKVLTRINKIKVKRGMGASSSGEETGGNDSTISSEGSLN